ncbi:MAG: beta-galactosidase trimerization domain-containing protein [Pseudomonas sp.]
MPRSQARSRRRQASRTRSSPSLSASRWRTTRSAFDADNAPRWWMEMLKPTTAQIVARYKHPSWPAAAAMTRNRWGKGEVIYIGFMPSDALAEKIVEAEVARAGVAPSVPGVRFPLIVRGGTLNGHAIRYVLNYSASPQTMTVPHAGTELLHDRKVERGARIDLAPWDVAIIEEEGRSE